MARISGVDLPRNKRIEIGLTYVFGIGNTSAKQIVKAANVSPSTRCGDLSDDEITTLRAIIDENYQTEGDLRRFYSQNIKRLTEIGSAAGRRHRWPSAARREFAEEEAQGASGTLFLPASDVSIV